MKYQALLFFCFTLLTGQTMAADNKTIYGYVEKVTLIDKDVRVSAKLDTGAKSASLNAININEISVNGVPYLQFTVPTKEGNYEFKAEYIGKVKIKARVGEVQDPLEKPKPIKRPMVLLHVKLGDKVRAIQVNLTNRKQFNYPLLLGREAIIEFDGIIDPSQAFTLRNNHEK